MVLPNRDSEAIIDKPKLLLVEGKDEVEFFNALLKKINKQDEVLVIPVGGKDNFKYSFPATVKRSGFREKVRSIAIVRDGDNDYMAAFESVKNIVKDNGYVPPRDPDSFNTSGIIKVGIFIMPGDLQNGMLEHLCLRTQAENPIMQCVDSFIQSVAAIEDITQPKNLVKAKAQAFLSVMPEIVNTVGLGAQKGYWNLEHDCLFKLNQFLDEL
ncbi:MAG: hypothetical protein Q8934_10920 [Bacillota bacterium]|nr:hypothetical protein [Bacillota bacterium]